MSNQDLKHFSKSDLLGFAGAVFHGFLPPEGDLTKELTKENYTSDPKSDIFEKVYTYDFWAQRHVFITRSTFFGSDKFKS